MLRLFGFPHFEGHPGLAPKAMFMVAAVLFEFGGVAPRQELASFLFEGATIAEARSYLRQLIYKTKRWQSRSGVRLLDVDGSTVRLAQAAWECDVGQFASLHAVNTADDLCRVRDLWAGEFLAGFAHDATSEDGASWVAQRREILTRHAAQLLCDAPHEVVGEELERLLGRLSLLLPYDDQIMLRRLGNLVALDRQTTARTVYREYVDRLRRHLDQRVSADTLAAVVRLLGQPILPDAAVADLANTDADGEPESIPRVVVLPPLAGQANAEAIRLGSGLIDDVVFYLCRQRSFAMIAPHSARRIFPARERVTLPLNVDYYVSTKMVPQEGTHTLRFQLVRLRTQEILLSDQIRFRLDLLENERQILARGIASALSDGIATSELASTGPDAFPSAYVSYLQGICELQNPGLASLRRARHHFEAAVRLRKSYVPALSAVAHTLSREWVMLGRADREMVNEALKIARSAVNVDPFHPDGLRELGNAYLYLNAFDESEHYHQEAVARAPHHADTLADAADLQVHLANFNKADQLISRAIDLNPFSPDDYLWIGGSVKFFLGDYSKSLRMLTRLKNQELVHRLIAASAAMLGDFRTAAKHREKWMQQYPDSRVADYENLMPHKSKVEVRRYIDALRLAGFK